MNSSPYRTDGSNSRHGMLDTMPARVVAMVALFASAAAVEARHLSSLSALSNSDLWWHLRTGLWILQKHAVPHSGLFSQSPDQPWTSSNWGYDALVALAYRALDLRAIPVLQMVFKFSLAGITFLLAGGLRGRFWSAAALSAVAQYILGGVLPGPTCCSIISLGVELLLLTRSRETHSIRPLFWLPALFLLWANLDAQFVYGMVLLVLFLAASLLRRSATVAPATAGILASVCLIVTFITPYTYHLYGVFFASVTNAANRYLPDFKAMNFHRPQDYVLMLLTMAAFLALGRSRSRDPFLIALVVGSAMLSFHAQRDAWLVVLASVTVIGTLIGPTGDKGEPASTEHPGAERRQELLAVGLSLLVLALSGALLIPSNHDVLLAKTAQTYPVAACNYIREHQLPQPLFNAYEWGGFLTWYLPEYPVAIDGRADLYGADSVTQYSKVMNADLPYTAYPPLAQAETLLLRRDSVMGEALGSVPAFRVAYSDSVAVVLTRP